MAGIDVVARVPIARATIRGDNGAEKEGSKAIAR